MAAADCSCPERRDGLANNEHEERVVGSIEKGSLHPANQWPSFVGACGSGSRRLWETLSSFRCRFNPFSNLTPVPLPSHAKYSPNPRERS